MRSAIALVMLALVVGMPFVFATQLNLTYDANGNLVTGDGKYRVYNSLNQLWKIYNGSSVNGTILETYVYHPTEERVWEKIIYNSSGNVSSTTYYFDQNHVRVVNSSGTYNFVYIYQNGDPVAQTLNGVTYFIHTDNKGSTSVVTNSTGGVVERDNYDPYGNPLNNSIVRYGYEARESDSVIGDTDFNARRYNPSLGIFSTPDTVIQNVYNPQQLNRYSFELNNPYKYVDPTGHWAVEGGASGEAGLALGATGELGGTVSYSPSSGTLQYGVYETVGGGAYAGVGFSAGPQVSYFPGIDYISELNGRSLSTGVEAYYGLGGGGSVIFGGQSGKLGIFGFGSTPIGYSVTVGGGLQASGHGFITDTRTLTLGSINLRGSGVTINPVQAVQLGGRIAQVYNNAHVSNSNKNSIYDSMARTASRSDITWYYSDKDNTYTWRKGSSKPSEDYKKI